MVQVTVRALGPMVTARPSRRAFSDWPRPGVLISLRVCYSPRRSSRLRRCCPAPIPATERTTAQSLS